MQDATARFVYPVLELGLDLRRQVLAGRPPAFDQEHARVRERLLAGAGDSAVVGALPRPGGQPVLGFLGVRYALVCWLDEVFTRAPGWADRWNERKLEGELYGTNDRAWKFWEQARAAAELPADDAVEVFYLCVRLGFRGNLSDSPAKLGEWVTGAQNRLVRLAVEPTPFDLEPDPVPDVPPRHGDRKFERMMAAAGAVLMLLLPAVGFLLAYRAGGR